MIRKLWISAAAAFTLGLAQGPAVAQYGPPSSGPSAAVLMTPGTVNLVAGLNGQGSTGNGGLATAAQLNFPMGIAYDSNGNLYIADSGNYEVRKIDTTGHISAFAGTGSFGNTAPAANAQATSVGFGSITGLAIDSSNNVYFADRTNEVIWEVNTSGVITIFAGTLGSPGYSGDTGPSTSAKIDDPYGLAFDPSGNLYVGDVNNNVVRVIGTSGQINTFAGNGTGAGQFPTCPASFSGAGGVASAAELCSPYGVAADGAGNIYISSYTYGQVYIVGTNSKINVFAGVGGSSAGDTGDGGPATSANLWRPFGLYADPAGDVYIVDQFGSFIREVNTSKIISTVYGNGSGDVTKAVLGTPDTQEETFNIGDADGIYFITMDPDGNFVVPSADASVVLSAGSTGSYFFGHQQIYATYTSTSLNGSAPAVYPPYVTLTNPSGVTLDFTGTPTVTGPFAIGGGTCSFPGSLAAGSSCTVILSFTPTVGGSGVGTLATGSIVISSNANNVSQSITTNLSPLTISLSGYGTGSPPTPVFTLGPPLSFTSPANVTSASQQMTLTNTGQIPFTIVSYQTNFTSAAEFAVSSTTCPSGSATLGVNDSCIFNITFTPNRATTFQAGFQVCVGTSTDPDDCSLSVNLSGTGTGTATFGPAALAFGPAVVGQTSGVLSTTLTNGTSGALTNLSISLTGANPADFAIATGPNACGNELNGAGGTCSIYVTFTPGSAIAFSAALQVTGTNIATTPATMQTVDEDLTGTGVSFVSNVGTALAAQAVTVYIATAGTLNSIQLLTTGAANLDFTMAAGGTCALGTTYTVGESCTVSVIFTPEFVGARTGSVLLTDAGGNVLGTTYLPGTGNGPQIVFGPGVQTTLPPPAVHYNEPVGVAVDAGRNVFISDTLNNRVVKLPWTGSSYGTPIVVPTSGLNQPGGIAVDGSGNLWIADTQNNRIVEVPWTGAAYGTQTALAAGSLSLPDGVAVDGNGNVYIADTDHNRLVEVPRSASGYGAPTLPPVTGLSFPRGVAVDANESVYVSDTQNARVVELPWTGSGFGAQTTLPASNLFQPFGLAVSGGGSVYIANSVGGAVVELPWNGSAFGAQVTVPFSALSTPAGVALDGSGNIYVADGGANDAVELDLADPPSLSFASTNVGSTSADSPKTVTVTNIGNASLIFSSGTNPNYPPANFPVNSLNTSLCASSAPLAEGASCAVSVSFMPAATGLLSGNIVLTDTDLNGIGATQSIAVSGTGLAPQAPIAALAPPSLAFSSITVGTTSTAMFAILSNTGNAALTGITPTLTGVNPSDFSITTGANACGVTLAAGSSCNIFVTFTPASAVSFTATLSVTDNASSSPQTVSLTGTGAPPPAPIVSLTPPALAFPSTAVGSTATALVITLKNTGNAALTGVTATLTGANPSDFAITASSNPCPGNIPSGYSCTFNVTFTPASATSFSATFSLADNATGSPQTVTLTGTGTQPPAPIASLTPPVLPFPSTTTGTTAAALVATLSNSGNAALTGITPTLTGTNPSDFAITTGSNACAATLAAGSNCSVYITFTPASAAGFSATLSVADNASGSPQTVTLTGTGTPPPAPIATLTPTLAFPSTVVGSTATGLVATLSNTGNAALTGITPTLTGTNPADFAITTGSNACAATLAAGANCSIYVTFTPASAASFSATLSVADNASGSPQTTALTGTGTPPPDFALTGSPTSLTVAPGAAATYMIAVQSNNGSFGGVVTFSVAGLPTGATDTFSPMQVTPGSEGATTTMTVQTPAIAMVRPANERFGWPLATPALALLFLLPFRRWRKMHKVLAGKILLLVVGLASLAAAVAVTGCSGGFGLLQSQTYTLTVTGASGSDTHSTTVQLTVNR